MSNKSNSNSSTNNSEIQTFALCFFLLSFVWSFSMFGSTLNILLHILFPVVYYFHTYVIWTFNLNILLTKYFIWMQGKQPSAWFHFLLRIHLIFIKIYGFIFGSFFQYIRLPVAIGLALGLQIQYEHICRFYLCLLILFMTSTFE